MVPLSHSICLLQLSDELRSGVSSLNSSSEQVRDVVSQHLGFSILNCVSDVNFSVANLISSRVVEEFMIALATTLASLVSSPDFLLVLGFVNLDNLGHSYSEIAKCSQIYSQNNFDILSTFSVLGITYLSCT